MRFVGISSRSKRGCRGCRQRKKKCDEVHPVCGLCQRRGAPCVWNTEGPDTTFSMARVQKSGKLARKGRPTSANAGGGGALVFVDQGPLLANMAKHVKSPRFSPTASAMDHIVSAAVALHAQDSQRRRGDANLDGALLSPTLSALLGIEGMGEAETLESLARLTPLNVSEGDAELGEDPMALINGAFSLQRDTSEDSRDDDDAAEPFLPMDESHMLENTNMTETELLTLFHAKTFQPYLKPAIHALFNKNAIRSFVEPLTPALTQLDQNGILFLEHYVSYVAPVQIDIGNRKFFLDYAVGAAANHPAILFCLVAWGGMFLLGRGNSHAHRYLTQSRKLITTHRRGIRSNEDLLAVLSFYLLSLASEISTGDVQDWYQMLHHCRDLINQFGGFEKFVEDNRHSNVARWIVSSIFFHDVLNTRALDHGTIFPMDQYHRIMRESNLFGDESYGLDPFQGLSYELYLIMGDVINARLELKKSLFQLRLLNPDASPNALFDSIQGRFEEFETRIEESRPPPQMVNEIIARNDPDFLECHLTLFELTQVVLQIYLRISYVQRPFNSPEIQALRRRGHKLFAILVPSQLQSMLCLPLLMLGIVSITPSHRASLAEMYADLVTRCEIKNNTVCWEIVRQVWETVDAQQAQAAQMPSPISPDSHPEPIVFTDWTEIVSSLGWNCCFT